MNAEYISLATVAKHMDIYERMPIMMQSALRQSVWLSLISNIVCLIVLLYFIPNVIYMPIIIEGPLSILNPLANFINYVINFFQPISELLIPTNIFSIIIILLVLIASIGMTKPVKEEIHWLAWFAGIPCAISIVSISSMIILYILGTIIYIILYTIITILVIGFGIVILIGFLNSFGK